MDFRPKPIDFGFVILAPEPNVGRIKTTRNCIRYRYTDSFPCICVVGSHTKPALFNEVGEVCPVYKGKRTITSMINTGMKKGSKGWNFLIMEGMSVIQGLDRQYSKFIEKETDVLFPLTIDKDMMGKPVNMHLSFVECSLNGICIHQNFYKEVGDMHNNTLELERLLWALSAINKGCQFKGLVGIKGI